jgi:hypothetical protein
MANLLDKKSLLLPDYGGLDLGAGHRAPRRVHVRDRVALGGL